MHITEFFEGVQSARFVNLIQAASNSGLSNGNAKAETFPETAALDE